MTGRWNIEHLEIESSGMSCLDEHAITALFAGRLSRVDRDRLDRHVDTCAECRRWVAVAARDHVGRDTTDLQSPRSTDVSAPLADTAVASSTRITLPRGAQVGRYVVDDFLGAGAMGVVYAAHDPQLDRVVALKVVRSGVQRDRRNSAARVVREAQAMARVSHPNVIPIYDAGQTDAVVFIAMKRVDGVSLRRQLDRKPTFRERIRLVCGAGRGLAAAHAAGIIHRDFKPDNVLVDRDGVAQVGDFGLAVMTTDGRDTEPDERSEASETAEPRIDHQPDAAPNGRWQTLAGTVLGTPAYMAPEVRDGGRADALSDQYSFAVTAAEALGPSLPRRIERALRRARSEHPSRRFASLEDLLSILERRPIAPWLGLATLGLIAIAWFAWPTRSDPAAACDDAASRRLDATYGGRTELIGHLANLPHLHPADATATLSKLDRYASRWLELHQAACRAGASHEQSEQLRDLRMACLDERLDELAVVSRNLAALADARADAVPRLAGVLGDLEQCTNPNGLRVREGDGERTRALRARLAEAHALVQQGYFDRATPMFDAVLADARAGNLSVVEAETLLGRAVVLARTRRPGAIEGFHQALAIAERIGDTALRVDALIALLADAAIDRSRASEVELLVRMIETGLTELPGDQTLRRARLAGNLANYYHDKRDFPAAERSAAIAVRGFGETLGAFHPYTLMARGTEAHIQGSQLRYDKATAITTELLADLRRTYGDAHPMVAEFQLSEGVYLALAQRNDEARVAFERARAIAEAVYGPDDVRVADALRKIGFLEMDRDARSASAAFSRAIAIYEKSGRRDAIELAPLLAGLGEAQLLAGEPVDAVATLERALAMWGDSRVAPHLIPNTKYVLARALWDGHGDRERARRLAEEARGEFLANQGPWKPKAKEVAAWLSNHRIR